MNELTQHVFIDESGTNTLSFDKPNTSHLFIMTAIFIEEKNLIAARDSVISISKKLTSGGEIKSSNISSNHKRRIKFLKEIKNIPFSYYALIINKSKLRESKGFQYKQSFYKHMNKRLYSEINKIGGKLNIYADKFGSSEFMASFEGYCKRQGMPDLFSDYSFTFCDSQHEPLIQLADLIAGTLFYCFDQEKKCQESLNFRNLLKEKEAGIDTWPIEYKPITSSYISSEEDVKIILLNRAIEFIKQYSDHESIDRRMQGVVLRRLMFAQEFEEETMQSVYSDKLIKQLVAEGYESLSKQQFSSRIIGKIRDEGVILVGATDGYKLASSLNDICEYLNHDRKIIEPMLARISKAKKTMLDKNIFCDSSYELIEILVNVFEDFNLQKGIENILDRSDEDDF